MSSSSKGITLDNDMRTELATRLNDIVDIPLIGEDQEQDMALKLIDLCLGPIADNEPATEEMAEMTRHTDRGVMETTVTSNMVAAVNARINVPFVNEEQEEKAITLIVCFLMKGKFEEAAELAEEIEQQEAQQEKVCAMCTII